MGLYYFHELNHCKSMFYELPVSGQKGKGKVFLVDQEDLALAMSRSWTETARGYLHATINNSQVRLHRAIMKPGPGLVVDHVNGNPLDNRRSNLRVCTQANNTMNQPLKTNNRSGYKGVAWHSASGKWIGYIGIGAGKKKHLGLFEHPHLAAAAYNRAAVELYGEFASLNNLLQ